VEVRILFGASREPRVRGALLVLKLFGRGRLKPPPVAFEQPETSIVRWSVSRQTWSFTRAADEATYLERLQEAVEAALDASTSSHVGW
jgi:hypothetical protein